MSIKTTGVSTVTLAALALFLSEIALAASNTQTFTVTGTLNNTAGNPMTGTVTMKFGILDPGGTCTLYEESQSVTLSDDGEFSAQVGSAIGSGKRVVATDPGHSMATVFSNSVTTLSATGCGSYSPAAGDGRKLRVTVISGGTPIQLSPDQEISSAPQATTAETLQGLSPSSFIQQNLAKNLSQSNLETLTFSQDASTLHHHDSLYAKLSGSASIALSPGSYLNLGARATDPAGLTAIDAGKVWYNNSNNTINYWDGSTIKTLGTSVAVSSFNGRTGAVTLSQADAHAALGVASGTNSGYLSSADFTAFNNSTNATTAATAANTANAIVKRDGTGGFTTGSISTAAFTFTGGTPGLNKVLMSDASGNARWDTVAGVGTVTSVSAGPGLTGGPIVSSGSLSLATSGVTAATYTRPMLAIDEYGRVTSASSGGAIDLAGDTTGTLSVAKGGTGLTSFGNAQTLVTNGSGVLAPVSASSAGQVLMQTALGVVPSYGFITDSNIGTGSVSDSKLAQITTAGKVSGSAITSGTIGGATALITSGTISTTGTIIAARLRVTGGSPAANQVLKAIDTSGEVAWTSITSSQWTTNGSNIYFNNTTANVGIGANSIPDSRLHVNGSGEQTAKVQSTDNQMAKLKLWGSNSGWEFAKDFSTHGEGLDISHFNGTTYSNVMTLTPSAGVGVGTTAPTAQLHVAGTGMQTFAVEAKDDSMTRLRFITPTQTFGFALEHNTGYIPNSLVLYDYTTPGGAYRMVVKPNGNVGIGTENPSTTLEVGGISKATNFAYSAPQSRTLILPGATCSNYTIISGSPFACASSMSSPVVYPVSLPHGATLLGLSFMGARASGAAATITCSLIKGTYPTDTSIVASTNLAATMSFTPSTEATIFTPAQFDQAYGYAVSCTSDNPTITNYIGSVKIRYSVSNL